MSYAYSGKTALITGASSGIGEAFARALAERGMHLILVARSEDKLKALADRISKQHGIRATSIAADLSVPGAAKKLFADCQARDLRVDLLLNNAGIGTYGRFEDIEAERDNHLVQLNVAAVTDMAHLFIPPMLARSEGAVINLASSAGFQPTPWFAAYGASKAYVLSLSESLWALYRKRGVRVLAVCPGPVATGFFDATQSNIQDAKMFQRTMSAEQVVQQSLRALEKGRSTVVNGWLNWLTAFSPRLGPRWLTAWVSEILMRPSPRKA
jgi:uncharacterized protein